jgi:hypothetical protein
MVRNANDCVELALILVDSLVSKRVKSARKLGDLRKTEGVVRLF